MFPTFWAIGLRIGDGKSAWWLPQKASLPQRWNPTSTHFNPGGAVTREISDTLKKNQRFILEGWPWSLDLPHVCWSYHHVSTKAKNLITVPEVNIDHAGVERLHSSNHRIILGNFLILGLLMIKSHKARLRIPYSMLSCCWLNPMTSTPEPSHQKN